MTRADEDDVAEAAFDERHPSKDKGAQDDFAEFDVGLHETAKPAPFDLEQSSRATRLRVDGSLAAREHVDVTRESTRLVDRDEAIFLPDQDRDRSLENDEEVDVRVAGLPEGFAVFKPPLAGNGLEAGTLFGVELRKHVLDIEPRFDRRRPGGRNVLRIGAHEDSASSST